MTRLDPAERPPTVEVAREAAALRTIVAYDPSRPLTITGPVASAADDASDAAPPRRTHLFDALLRRVRHPSDASERMPRR